MGTPTCPHGLNRRHLCRLCPAPVHMIADDRWDTSHEEEAERLYAALEAEARDYNPMEEHPDWPFK